MASFHCDNAYWVMHQDLVVLSGYLLSGKVLPGWAVDLPREIKGPGWVPIRDVQMVDFAGKRKLCIVLDYDVLGHDPVHGQHLGILLIEFGVGMTVASVMIVIFFAFAGRGRRGRD